MDKDRQIRFLYPPFLILFSIAIALYFDENPSLDKLIPICGNRLEVQEIMAVIIGSGIIMIVLGFIIGTITFNILRLSFWVFTWGKGNLEIGISEPVFKNINEKLGLKEWNSKDKLYAGTTFDHHLIPEKIHQWTRRRWNAFYVSANTVTALVLSFFIILHLNIVISIQWITVISFITLLFIFNSIIAWHQTMRMIAFQSKCKYEKCEDG
ncbi:hypothetical protein ACFLS4_03870 [Bacteroidota bacterium]